jgi:aspartate/methionine/tyrosine aminotransferase
MRAARRIGDVQAPIIPIIGEWIRRNPGTISLGQGIVSYGPPPEALAALGSFPGTADDHRYGPVEGSPDLIDAIQHKLALENGFAPGSDRRVVVTAGSNMAFVNAVLAVTDPGDEVILQAPFYFNHDMAIVIAGCRTVAVATDDQYQLRLDAIRAAITPRTRAVVTISPNNPTGAVYPESALRAVNRLCAEHGLYHVHDEAYEYFTYGDAMHFSPGAIAGGATHTISLYSLSKTYGMASWRIGYMVIPAHLFEAVNKIQDTNLICPPVVSQAVACAAIRAGSAYCRERVLELAEIRLAVLEAFARVADICAVPRPDGAFYCLVRVKTTMDPLALVERLVVEHRVAAVPGTAFGLADGCYLRVSYGALDKETVAEGISRLVSGLRAIVG